MTKYRVGNIIFPSKKIYKDVRNIDNTIKSLLYIPAPVLSNLLLLNCSEERESLSKFSKALDKVEYVINCILKKVVITETIPSSFFQRFYAILFFYQESDLTENPRNDIDKRFVKLALKLWDLGVRPKEI